MKQGILMRLTAGEKSGLRSNEIKGFFSKAPEVGKSFTFYGDSLEIEDGLRVITTTSVTEVDIEPPFDSLIFKTASGSVYVLRQEAGAKA